MSQERLQILNMLEEGKISTDEASKLLAAIGERQEVEKEIAKAKSKAKWLKVKVWENDSEKPKVNVSVPLAVAKIALKLGGKFSTMMPKEARDSMEEKGINVDDLKDIEQVSELIDGMSHEGPFTLVEVDEENEKVLITIE